MIQKLTFFLFLIFANLFALAGPSRTTYQAKIVKPDGYPLEATNVNFKFSILDPGGSCILYAETYSAVNMSGSSGLISFALGSGIKTYPTSSTTFSDVFSNQVANLSCDAGGPGTYSPVATDNRKIVMQFNDGGGWQTLPAMSINAVPYAMYADKSNDAKTLNGKADSAFVENATLASLGCNSATHAIAFNGVSFSCLAVGSGASGTITSLSVTGPISSTGGSNPTLSIAQATSSSDGFLSAVDFNTFNNKQVSTSSAIITTLGYTPADNAASGTYLQKSDNLSDLSSITAARNNLGLGALATANNIDLGSASATGILAIARLPSFTGDAAIAVASNTIILSNSGVTAGTYSKVTVDTKGRVTSSSVLLSSDVTTALGYTPAHATSATQWTTSGTNIYYNMGNIGVGTASPEAKLHVSSGEILLDNNYALKGKAENGIAYDLISVATDGSTRLRGFHGTDLIQGVNGATYLYSSGGGSIKMTLLGDNVGVGISSPETKLHVASGTILLSNNYFLRGENTVGSNSNLIGRNSADELMVGDSGFNNPTRILSGNNAITFETNGLERLRVLSTGNIGIGTTSTTQTLEVSGSAKVTGNLFGAVKDVSGNALKMCTGTSANNTWVYYSLDSAIVGSCGAYIDVNTSSCGFVTIFKYFPTLGGNGSHWTTTGATSIYNQTATGFRIYINTVGGGFDSTSCNATTLPHKTNAWYIDWLAIGM